MNELKAKCEQIEKRAAEQRQVEEKKHTEEIQFLKRTNTQLKVNLSDSMINDIRCLTNLPVKAVNSDVERIYCLNVGG